MCIENHSFWHPYILLVDSMEQIPCFLGSGPKNILRRPQEPRLQSLTPSVVPCQHRSSRYFVFDRIHYVYSNRLRDKGNARSAANSAASSSGVPGSEKSAPHHATVDAMANLTGHLESRSLSTDTNSSGTTPHEVLMAMLSRLCGTRDRSKAVALTAASCIALPCCLVDTSSSYVSLLCTAWNQISNNYVFVVGFWGWFLAQFFKIFTKWYKTGIFSPTAFFDSGGMPSSHSSLCSAMTTAVAIRHGLGSSLFAACTCFTVIVMYDAMGVRRHAGLQAQVLNAVVNDLLEGHPVSERKLKEVLGHTPRQVMCGGILGILVGLLFPH